MMDVPWANDRVHGMCNDDTIFARFPQNNDETM